MTAELVFTERKSCRTGISVRVRVTLTDVVTQFTGQHVCLTEQGVLYVKDEYDIRDEWEFHSRPSDDK